ncbi:VOC family protein [uncultured Nitrospira sp.]|uniref:VOC family protein n=1 Tax=uncultured Nitrospira sp. TaxID=157176 RepID=UPI0031408C6C
MRFSTDFRNLRRPFGNLLHLRVLGMMPFSENTRERCSLTLHHIDGIEMQEKRKTRGLRHLALRVRDVQVSQRFYERLFDMKVVWQPDPENVYLSTGYDNLALHQVTSEELSQFNLSQVHPLDHLGFIMESPSSVDALFSEATEQGATIVKPLKQHRDGSYSFYLSDPDLNTIQVLFEPSIQL